MENKGQGLNISAKSFITALAVIFALMIGTYVLTFIIPGGEYARVTDASGNQMIDTTVAFANVEGGLPFWKWILSPFLVLGAEGSGTILAVLAFLIIVGGIFNTLGKSGLMQYMLDRIVAKFGKTKYRLLAIVTVFFMAMGAFIGSFEECVPLVPLVVAVCIGLGFDALTGLYVSLLAAGCGFASGVCNPFTVGVAQELAGLPMFSGMWLRGISFVLIYGLLILFIFRHAKKVEKQSNKEEKEFLVDKEYDKGLKAFAIILGLGIVLVLSSGIIPALQDYTMIIVSLMFLVAGIVSVKLAGVKWSMFGKTFLEGIVSVLPAVLMILMASSIKYILVEGNILDTILHWAVNYAEGLQSWLIILFIYLLVLVMNFFIASGSAKAFLLIPLIVPLAQMFGISSQLCVLAFAFGDGFSNAFYPTNPVLLISLGLADISYGTWVKRTWKFQLANLILTSFILIAGFVIGY